MKPELLTYDEALARKDKKRSVSQLQSYAKCGHAYWLERIIKVPGRKALWFTQGTAVHEAISFYEKSFLTVTVAEAQAKFEEVWHRELAADQALQPDESMWMVGGRKKWQTDHDQRFKLGRQQVEDYILANGPDAEWQTLELVDGVAGSELGFELDMNGVRVLGYIDLIKQHVESGEISPWDIKTGAHRPSDPYQMATYRHAIERMTGQKVRWGYWWMSKQGGLSEPQDLQPYDWDTVSEWYAKLDKGVKGSVFLGNPGDHCFTCTARPWCGIVQPTPLPLDESMPGWDPRGLAEVIPIPDNPQATSDLAKALALWEENKKRNPYSALKVEDFMETIPGVAAKRNGNYDDVPF